MILEKKVRLFTVLTAVLSALFFASCGKVYHVGDIVLTDGSVYSAAEFSTYKGSAKPEAVIFSIHGGDSENSHRVLGVMLKDVGEFAFYNKELLELASDDSTYNAISVLDQEYDKECNIYRNKGFSGAYDGRYFSYNLNDTDMENYEKLASLLPAFNACRNEGSYLPSASELYELFENNSAVNGAIAVAGGTQITNGAYWSSSADYDNANNHFTVNLFDGHLVSEPRSVKHQVRGIKCYSEKKRSISTEFNLGDVVMDNGDVVGKDEVKSYKGNGKPMAVIFSMRGGHFEETDRVLGVGLKASAPVVFAEEKSIGQITNFTLNQSITINQNFNLSRSFFINSGVVGVKNGSASWNNVCKMLSGKNTDISKFPAYEYAVNYGKKNGFKKYQKGWYLPSSMEAYELFEYLGIVNNSIEACGGTEIPSAVWTSSQYYYSKENQYLLDMKQGEVQVGFKTNSYPVVSIYCFKNSKKTVKE